MEFLPIEMVLILKENPGLLLSIIPAAPGTLTKALRVIDNYNFLYVKFQPPPICLDRWWPA
jgi:hypothetical protein